MARQNCFCKPGFMKSAAPHTLDGRIVSLDQFRGYTVTGMLLVNFGGGFAALPAVMKHHNTYCSYADTIMPHFLFAVGFALRLVLLRNLEKLGAGIAWKRVLRRITFLLLLGFLFYNTQWQSSGVLGFPRPKWRPLSEATFWRESFQTLVHIAITSLWVLPVITRSAHLRILFALCSGLLHLALSGSFWYVMLHAKHVIDGGPLGFLTWTTPLIAGSLAYDWRSQAGPRRCLRPLVSWGAVLMAAGYALSCLGVGGPVAAPPFSPPQGSVDMWTMSQRAGSWSYLAFAAGFSMIVYAIFVWACDLRGKALGLFAVFGQNALAAYLLHEFLDMPFSKLRRPEASLMEAVAVFTLFIGTNALIVAWFNKRRWLLRL